MASKLSASSLALLRFCVHRTVASPRSFLRSFKPSPVWFATRDFHASGPALFAKSNKGGKKKGGGRVEEDDDEPDEPKVAVSLPDVKTYDALMEKRLDRLVEEFDKLRVGRPSADMLNHIIVDVPGGARMKITELGQIAMKSQSTISISVFDLAHVSAVAAAIRQDSNMNLNPNTDGNTVIVNIPKPSKESRDAFIKAAAKSADKVNNVHIFVTTLGVTWVTSIFIVYVPFAD